MPPDFHLLYVFPEPLPLPRARGVQVAHFVRALSEIGIRVTLAYVPSGGSHPFVPIGSDVPANVTLLPISRSLPWPLQRVGFKSHRLFMSRLRQSLSRMFKQGSRPDVAFFRHIKAAAQFSSDFPDLPLIYEAHEIFAETAKASQKARLAILEQRVIHHASLVIANSRGSASGVERLYAPKRPVEILPNGVDFPATIPEKDWPNLHRKIIYAGSLFGWKGVDDLVEATRFLDNCHINVIGGTPEQISRLRERVPDSGKEIIEFSGQLPQHEVQHRLANACIAVLPNRDDPDSQFTSPLKLFEYMAAGCAVVATDLPPVRDVLSDEGAFWAKPGNPESLAEAIRGACASPERGRMLGQQGRFAVRTRTWKARARTLLCLWADRNGAANERLQPLFEHLDETESCAT